MEKHLFILVLEIDKSKGFCGGIPQLIQRKSIEGGGVNT